MGKFVINGPDTSAKNVGKNGPPKKTGVAPSTAVKPTPFSVSNAKQKTSKVTPQRG